MSQEERYNSRDGSYSAWHRRNSTRRFVGLENAQLLSMIDVDAVPYVEYDDHTKEPLAVIETAIDVGQAHKPATVCLNLAKRAGLPAYTVLYRLDDQPNPADPKHRDIVEFRVKRLYPNPDKEWRTMSPQEYAKSLVSLRRWCAERLDK